MVAHRRNTLRSECAQSFWARGRTLTESANCLRSERIASHRGLKRVDPTIEACPKRVDPTVEPGLESIDLSVDRIESTLAEPGHNPTDDGDHHGVDGGNEQVHRARSLRGETPSIRG
jgi:hypothetical protein